MSGETPPARGTPAVGGASQEALSTPELLDLVFQHLTPSLLFFSAKRVCKIWYRVVSNPSPDLQVSLFLRPATNDSLFLPTPTFNDVLTSAFPFWLLNRRELPRPGICSCRPNKCGPFSTATSVTLLPWKRNPSAWNRNTAWRDMLIVQPPCTEVAIMKTANGLYPHEPDWRWKIHSTVACPEGLTMGKLYDFVEEWIQKAKLTDKQFVPESRRERMNNGRSLAESKWERKELYVRDNSGQLLFLHLDLDRYSLTKV